MNELVFLNGEIVEAAAARLPVSDAGLSHGAGLFETVRVYNANPFKLDDHLRRMRHSGKKLGIAVPWDDAEITRAVSRILQANELREARLRITVTPGDLRAGLAAEDGIPPATLLITAQKFEAYSAEYYRKGMTVCVSSYKQNKHDPTTGHKTVSYFPRLLALREAHGKQCGEALWFTTDNQVAEGCVSNVFVISKDKLRTPPLDTPVLPGIARAVTLQCAAARKIEVVEEPLTINDLLEAEEVFLTNTIMEILPVCRVERHPVSDETVGDFTRTLREAYFEVVQQECRIGG